MSSLSVLMHDTRQHCLGKVMRWRERSRDSSNFSMRSKFYQHLVGYFHSWKKKWHTVRVFSLIQYDYESPWSNSEVLQLLFAAVNWSLLKGNYRNNSLTPTARHSKQAWVRKSNHSNFHIAQGLQFRARNVRWSFCVQPAQDDAESATTKALPSKNFQSITACLISVKAPSVHSKQYLKMIMFEPVSWCFADAQQ
jgi:hypothetical protein